MADLIDNATDTIQHMLENRPTQAKQTYVCHTPALGRFELDATSPSDCIAQLEALGIGLPGHEDEFAFVVPKGHNRGGEKLRGNPEYFSHLS